MNHTQPAPGRAFSNALLQNRVIAADKVNRFGGFLAAKRMVTEHMEIAPTALTDEAVPLKTILAASAAE